MPSLAGTWRGVYQYEVEEESLPIKAINFTLVLEQRWFGRLRGEIEDDLYLGQSLTATVQGRLRGRNLFFRKIPAEFVTLGKNGLRPVAEYVQEAFGEQVKGDPRPPHVHYHGQFNPALGRVEGVWHIPSYLLPLRSSKGYLIFPETHGTWWIQRQLA